LENGFKLLGLSCVVSEALIELVHLRGIPTASTQFGANEKSLHRPVHRADHKKTLKAFGAQNHRHCQCLCMSWVAVASSPA
jgi:hypothetical protein